MESAPLARWVAERLCPADAASGSSCSWYHGFWQILRVLDLVTTPAHHAAFFADAFAAAARRGGRPRVLVSGAIDYSMLAHVLWACARRGAAAEATVIDICDTPLFLNRWYARRVGAGIRTFRCDVLDFDAPGAFDVVCTHSFLGQLSLVRREALMVRWRRLLKPGGLVITVNRVRPQGGARAGFSARQARALRETVLRKARGLEGRLEIGQQELASYAEAYAARRRPYPVSSREEIAALFERGGFVVEHLSCGPVSGYGGALSGPTTPGGAEYARLIARRR